MGSTPAPHRAGHVDEARATLEPAMPLHAPAKLTPQGHEQINVLEISQAHCSV